MEKAAEERYPLTKCGHKATEDNLNWASELQRKAFIAGWQQCQQEGDKEISKLQESLLDVVTQSMKEIERLKILLKTEFIKRNHGKKLGEIDSDWQQFKTENNL